MRRIRGRIVTFDGLRVGDVITRSIIKVKTIRVVDKSENSIKIELEGIPGRIFSLSKKSVNEGKYSFLA